MVSSPNWWTHSNDPSTNPVFSQECGLLCLMVGCGIIYCKLWSSGTVAVVTGSNKGIGLELVRKLAEKGITVVMTSHNEKSGRAVLESLYAKGLTNVVLQELEIGNPVSDTKFAMWIKATYNGLKILVNNTAIADLVPYVKEVAIEGVETNYYGTINVTETLLPLLRVSSIDARIVIVNSIVGQLKNLRIDAMREQLTDPDTSTQATMDNMAQWYLAACQGGQEEADNFGHAYYVSKIFLNAYARLLTKRVADRSEGHKIYVNCTHPGLVQTDSNRQYGVITLEEGVDTTVWVALLPLGGPNGGFFYQRKDYITRQNHVFLSS